MVVDFPFNEIMIWFIATDRGPALAERSKGIFDIELVKLGSSDTFTRPEQTFTIISKDRFRGGDEQSLATAEIMLQKSKPCGVHLKYSDKPGAELALPGLYSKIPSNPSDPAEKQLFWSTATHPNLALHPLAIDLVTAGTLPMNRETKDNLVGFHAEAAVYLFNKPFDLRLDIGAAKDKGVVFTTETISRWILRFLSSQATEIPCWTQQRRDRQSR